VEGAKDAEAAKPRVAGRGNFGFWILLALQCVVRNLFFAYYHFDSTAGDGPQIFMIKRVCYDFSSMG
jgi:hypothetical protein